MTEFQLIATTPPADANVRVGECALWFDSTAGAAQINYKARDAAGAITTGQVKPPNTATGYSLSGPASGNVGVASTVFTVTLTPAGGTVSGPVVETPSDQGAGGTFTPATVQLTTAAPSATFTYTPASSGTKTISCTNNGGLSDPAGVTYTAAPPPFDPTQVTGLQGWWKADSLALSDGAPVASWTDSSTHGRNATPGVAPTFVLNPLSMGKPAVHFTSGTVLRFTAIPIATPAGYTIIAVTFRAAGWTLNVMSANTGSPAPEGLDCGGGNAVYMSDAGGRVVAPIQSNRWSVYTQTSDYASTYHGFENGMPLTLGATGGWASANHYDQIGMRGDGDSGDGYIAELLFYDHVLSDADRLSVEKYLGDKYAISVAGIVGTIAGLKGWWAADKITAGSLLRGTVKKELVKTVLKGVLITTIPIGPDSMAAPADGAAVSTWPDASGNGKDFVSTYGSPPTYVASGVNGKPIVRCLGDAFHVLDCNPFSLNQPDTIIIVAKKPNVATNGILIDQAVNDSVNRQTLQIAPTTGFFGGLANPTGGLLVALSDTINHQGAFHIFVGVFNGASSSLLVDGILTASGDIGAANLANVRLQSNVAGSVESELDMAEILIYDHALSTTDRQNVEAYLKAKYGL